MNKSVVNAYNSANTKNIVKGEISVGSTGTSSWNSTSFNAASAAALKRLNAIGMALEIIEKTYKTAKKAYKIGAKFVESYAPIEQQENILYHMLGSETAARAQMMEYFEFAESSPFNIHEVMEAGNHLQSVGIYSFKLLDYLGNLSAATGKSLQETAEAYTKLAEGKKNEAVNLFKDMGISMDDWIKITGKGIEKNGELKASIEDMCTAFPQIIEEKGFLHAMEQRSQSAQGSIDNLNDAVDRLKSNIGKELAPAINFIHNTAANIINGINNGLTGGTTSEQLRRQDQMAFENSINTAINSPDKRKLILDNAKQQYPELLNDIDTGNITEGELKEILSISRKNRLKEDGDRYKAQILEQKQEEIEEVDNEIVRLSNLRQVEETMGELGETIVSQLKSKGLANNAFDNLYFKQGIIGHVEIESYIRKIKDQHKNGKVSDSDMELINNLNNYDALLRIKDEIKVSFKDWQSIERRIKSLEKKKKKALESIEEYVENFAGIDLLNEARSIDLEDPETLSQFYGKEQIISNFLRGNLAKIELKESENLTGLDKQILSLFNTGNLPNALNAILTQSAALSQQNSNKNNQKHTYIIHLQSLIGETNNTFNNVNELDTPEKMQAAVRDALIKLLSGEFNIEL